jgi:DNA-binding ferritin-like protein
MVPMAIDLSSEFPAVTGLRRIVADAVLLRLHAETAIWNLDSTSAGAAMVLERASAQLDELMRSAAIRVHVLQGSTSWSVDELRVQSRVSGKEMALSALARELERLCEDCRAVMTLSRQSEDTATERLLAARVMPLEQAVWGLNQFCRLNGCAAR